MQVLLAGKQTSAAYLSERNILTWLIGGDPQSCGGTGAACNELRRSGGETEDNGRRREDPGHFKTRDQPYPHRGSKFENHTAEQVITKLRGVVDARRDGVAVDR
ncbi:hypothetical protein EVAR_91923_1 [Eumeta japonica]|uniref:Uncharacterized protein n=1 Tax=Eumeta variegata TaxID=151549 RepID=A0A4C1SWS6_EUMVA|nr:hypothetical protein EVAR_91923_1 [Eumeta japonica]